MTMISSNTNTIMFEPMFMNDQPQFMSIYIPNIDHNVTKTQLRNVIEQVYSMGQVDRIDFVAHGSTSARRMGFIHMKEWSPMFCQNSSPCFEFRSMMESNMPVIVRWVNTDSITAETNLYEVELLVNQRPAPKTELNIDQIADSTSLLNEKLTDISTKTQVNIETIGIIHDSMEMLNDVIDGVNEQINNLHLDTFSMMDDITNLRAKEENQSNTIQKMMTLIETQQNTINEMATKLNELESRMTIQTNTTQSFDGRIGSMEQLLTMIKDVFFAKFSS